MATRNKILADIVVASGGTITLPETRNSLLQDWLDSLTNRFFRLNEGTTDYISIPTVAPSGSFDVFVSFSTTATSGFPNIVTSEDVTNGLTIFISGGTGSAVLKTAISGVDVTTPISGSFNDGRQHRFKLSFEASTNKYSISVNGGFVTSQIRSGVSNNLSSICRSPEGFGGFPGVVSDLEVFDAGLLIRRYAIDDNSNTIVDSVGGFDGTVINGNTDDWGSFQKIANGWKGQGLAVPPWDSVDQELIEA